MNLIERYVTDIGRRVPARNRAEIQAELRAAVDDALQARNASASSENDVVEVLREFGSPERVAAGYFPASQYLIGPEFFPLFKRVVFITLVVQLALAVGGFFVAIAMSGIDSDAGGELLTWVGFAFRSMTFALAVILIIFAGIERMGVSAFSTAKEWDPRKLPQLAERDLVSRAESAFGLVVAGVTMVIAYEVANAFRTNLPAAAQPLLASLFDLNLVLLNIALMLSVVVFALLLVEGGWRTYTRVLRLAADALGAVVCIRAALTLVNGRTEMLAAGVPGVAVTGIVFSAVATAVIAVGTIVWFWTSFMRRRAMPVRGPHGEFIIS